MKYQERISRLSLWEKAALLSGKTVWETREIPREGIPAIFLADGPHGVRKQAGASDHLGLNPSQPATCFPTAATVANSWDPALGEEIGAAIGREAAALDVDVVLGPGLNMKRSPLCGRNFEYFSEDPYLAGKMAAGYIRGIQSAGVSACPKHFAVNNQELCRMVSDSIVDERTLREIYLTAFEIAVKEAEPATIMSSYNRVNGEYANENRHLLQDILRDEWGFQGLVLTDWGGSNDVVEGVRAGSGLEMPAPGLDSARQLVKAVQSGRLPEEAVDERVDELLGVVMKKLSKKQGRVDRRAHHALARRAAEQSIVLLKNEGGILPLQSKTKVAVLGDFAESPRYQGAGSSLVNATELETTLEGIQSSGLELIGFAPGFHRNGKPDDERKRDAVNLAKTADVVLLYLGLDEISETEGLDRSHMRLHSSQIELLEAVALVNSRIVVVLSAGSAVEMPWRGECAAIVHGYLGGQAGASAMLRVLTGEVNPSGKLAESYPMRYEDGPNAEIFPSSTYASEYREALYIGYRYYQTAGITVAFPFGFGMSYTTFAYTGLLVTNEGVTFTVKNTGTVEGAEIAQLYIGCKQSGIFRAAHELKGFAKVFLKAGESKEVTIPFDDKTFRYFNVRTNAWEVETAEYAVMVGASSTDIRLEGSLSVFGTEAELPYDAKKLPSYFSGNIKHASDDEFALLLGRELSHNDTNGIFGRNDAICRMGSARSGVARLIYRIITARKEKSERKGAPDLNILFVYNMPLRAIAKMTNGMVSMDMVDGIVTLINGHFFRGIATVIGGFFRNRKANRETQAILDNAR